jgi:antitoxin HigA-1
MAMHNPSHPGEFIIQVYLEPNSLSGRELAGKLGVAASTLNRILTGSSRISPENGTTPVQGAWPFAGELAGHAV